MLKRFRQLLSDWFLCSMIVAVVLASCWPGIGRSGGALRIDQFADIGIFLVFFLHGVGLSTEHMKAGLLRWKLHLVVQTFTFAVFPLLWLLFNAAFSHWLPPALMLGFFYLCALPSTISSSVAMTGAARGNVAAAIFNASLSSLLGIFLTPLLVSWMAAGGGQGLSLGTAVLKLATLLLLPLVLGQLLRPLLGVWFGRYKRYTNLFDKGVILLLVLNSFSDSVQSGLWTQYGLITLVQTILGCGLILATVLWLSRKAARQLGFAVEDEITAVFCGSKKTLASGVPMAKLLFGAHPGLGLIVLPIMFYHQLQLFVCSILAERYAKRD